MKTAALLAFFVMAGMATLPQTGHAQAPQNSPSPQPQAPAAGQQCVACHGARGEGNAASGFPRIAGQSQRYLLRQLDSYTDGTRRNAIMEPIAKGLSPEDKAAVAAYYSQLDAPAAQRPAGTAQPPERGSVLAMKGDDARRVQACINCHGPGGVGEPPLYPYLSGLDATYMTNAINEWKSGTRKNDAGAQMATVANALSAEDVAAVSQYFASLPPPRPSPLNLLQAPTYAKSPASGTPPTSSQPAGPAPGKSVGSEQGAPTTGGTQGPGGSSESQTAK
jgi:cytochrome c553